MLTQDATKLQPGTHVQAAQVGFFYVVEFYAPLPIEFTPWRLPKRVLWPQRRLIDQTLRTHMLLKSIKVPKRAKYNRSYKCSTVRREFFFFPSRKPSPLKSSSSSQMIKESAQPSTCWTEVGGAGEMCSPGSETPELYHFVGGFIWCELSFKVPCFQCS